MARDSTKTDSCLVASIALNACSPATGSISPSASFVSSEGSSDLARSDTKRSASSLLFITGSEYSEILDYDQAGKNQYPAGEFSINGPVDLAGTFNIDAPGDNLWIAAGFVTYRVVIRTKAVTDEIENPEDAGFARDLVVLRPLDRGDRSPHASRPGL